MIRATFAGFATALSALQANQKRLDVTGHNLSNMNTAGYTRQRLDTSSLNYTGPISHYRNGSEIAVGFGTSMDRVTQIRDPFLDAQYRTQMGKSGYTDAMQTTLDSLSDVMDESNIRGIRSAFDDIQSVLSNLHDPAKIYEPVYESELRARMEIFTNLMNDSAKKITDAQVQEYQRLDGEGTNENGAEQRVNEILEQIGKLNRQIKHNQVFDQQSLELQDERNLLLDELSGYVPIEVTYYKDDQHIGDKDWPDDLRVDMVYYQTENGKTEQKHLTLVDGTEGAEDQNYGRLEITNADGGDAVPPYLGTCASFTAAESTKNTTPVVIQSSQDAKDKDAPKFKGGSIQAGLDVLADTGEEDSVEVRGYQYYMNQLDTLAGGFAKVMNELNKKGQKDISAKALGYLMVNTSGDPSPYTGITAANIGINPKWTDGTVHLGLGIEEDGNNATDTVLAMLQAMSHSYNGKTDASDREFGVDLGDKTFADFMNNVSTILATDSYSNQASIKTNVTILNGIQDSKDAVSGVSLDEEAANMMTYLSAYNAASRLMTAMDEALDRLINSTGLVGR